MKKLLVIPLLLFYLLGISGVTVSSHYCCGKLASVQISYPVTENGHSSKKDKKGCCNDITHFYKVNTAQQSATVNFSFEAPVLHLAVFLPAMDFAYWQGPHDSGHATLFYSPPLRTTIPLFIRHEVFLI